MKLRLICPWMVLLVLLLCASPATAQVPSWLNPWSSSESDEVAAAEQTSSKKPSEVAGTPEWWRKYRRRAVFAPGKGYQVEGFEGYYDKQGRPINAPVDELSIKLDNGVEEYEGLIPGLDPKSAQKRVREAVGLGPNQQIAQQLLQKGIGEFQAEAYGDAAATFSQAAARWPGSALEAQALFNQGESYFRDERYEKAADTYLKLLDRHPNAPRLNDTVERLWSIANHWKDSHFRDPSRVPLGFNVGRTLPTNDTIGHAIRLYEAIRLNDPTGPRADDAIMQTAGIHFARGQYSDADYHYGLLRKEYARSEHQFEAHLLGLQSKLRIYQGPDYDASPLTDAKQLEERIRVNFSGRLSDEERTRLDEERAKIQRMIEERELHVADYYAGAQSDSSSYLYLQEGVRKYAGAEYNASAKIYLKDIVRKYGDSPVAQQARERLEALEGKPDTPPTRMAWFVDLFPRSQELQAVDGIVELPTGGNLNPDAGATQIARPQSDTTTR